MTKSLFSFGGNKEIKSKVDAHVKKQNDALTPQQLNDRENAHLEEMRENIRKVKQQSSSANLRETLSKIAATAHLSTVLAEAFPSFKESAEQIAAAGELTSRLPLEHPQSPVLSAKLLEILHKLELFQRTLAPLSMAEPELSESQNFQIILVSTNAVIKHLKAEIGDRNIPQEAPQEVQQETQSETSDPTPMQTQVAKSNPFLLVQAALPTTTLIMLETQAAAMAEESPTEERIQLLQQLSALRGSASIIGKLATKSALGIKAEPLAHEASMIINQLDMLLQDGLIEAADAPIEIPTEDIQQLLGSPMTQQALQDVSKCQAVVKKALSVSRETSHVSALKH